MWKKELIAINMQRVLACLIDIARAGSVAAIAIILITGGIRLEPIGVDLVSLKRPAIILALTILLKKYLIRRKNTDFIVDFINSYSLRRIQFFIFIISLTLAVFVSSEIIKKTILGGDEPHFLMITKSIAKDCDLNLRNNQDNGDFYEFYPGPLAPHAKVYDDDKIYSAHGIGVPILMLPGYILGSTYGAFFTMNIVSAILTVIMFSLLCYVSKNRILSVGISFLFSFTMPLVFYSYQIYAELPAAMIVLYLFYVISSDGKDTMTLNRNIIIGILLLCLPWIHVRYIYFVVLLLAYLLYKAGYKKTLIPIGMSVVSFCLLMYYMKSCFGEMSISAQYTDIGSSIKWPVEGIFGNMIDSRFGLLLYSPFYIFVPAGLYFLYKKDKKLFYWWMVFVVPFIVGVSSFYHWHGGCCPPLRYIVPVIPLFAVPLGCILSEYRSYVFYAVFTGLVYIGFVVKNIISVNTLLMVNYEYSDSGILNYFKLLDIDLYWLFPTVTEKNAVTFITEFLWIGFLFSITYVIVVNYNKRKGQA
jgi:hypothetical protein